MPRLPCLRPRRVNDPSISLAGERTELVLSSVATKTQRIALVSVVVLGAGAVLIDRLVLKGGDAVQTASAEDLLIKEPGAASASSRPEPQQAASRSVLTVLSRLQELPKSWDSNAPASDVEAFTVPAHWLAKINEQPKAEAPSDAHAGNGGASGLHLSTVVCTARGGAVTAYINNRAVKVGETIMGYRLMELHVAGEGGRTASAAVLEGPAGRVELVLDPVTPSDGAIVRVRQ